MDYSVIESEFFRPMHTAWLAKLDCAEAARKDWKEVSDECLMFYGKSAAAMWSDDYSKKFWKGVKAPKFRITVNKAFELVAIFGPSLLWENPFRNVVPRKKQRFDLDDLVSDPNMLQFYQQLQEQQDSFESTDRVTAQLMQTWLNYTVREIPGGGLVRQCEKATTNALIKGRGIIVARPYITPGSNKVITGGFNLDPEDLLIDPDAKSLDDAKWIAIRHVDPYWEVERRFQLPKDTLKEKATLESLWRYSEAFAVSGRGTADRKAGKGRDLVVWYEILSKMGAGCRNCGMVDGIQQQLEEIVGQYAYIAICDSVPWPLNCPSDRLRDGMTNEEVQQAFSWPIQSWKDSRWPMEVIDFYPDPTSPWPMPPLQPAMGELKLLNFLIPWLCNRVWSSSRDFWAVPRQYLDDYRETILKGEDQSILAVPPGVDDVRKSLQILQQPETRGDLLRIIEFVSMQFDKRTGLMATAYGGNEGGTQNRTAEETIAKQRAIGIRPEYMQKQVVKWQSDFASLEAFITKTFVTSADVDELLGPLGARLWQDFIEGQSDEKITRQYEYTIEANSIRRPNRDRDVINFQQAMNIWMPVMQQYGASSGDYEPMNALMRKWAEYHDADLDDAMIPEKPEPDPEEQQMQQQQQMLAMQKDEATIAKLQGEAQRAAAMAQMQGQADPTADQQMRLMMAQQEAQLKLGQKQQEFEQKTAQDVERFNIEMIKKALST
jgi:hypothetical protein